MLTASFTTRRAYASVFLVGLFMISMPFTVGLAQELEGNAGRWMSMFSLLNIPLHVNDVTRHGAELRLTSVSDTPSSMTSPATLSTWETLGTRVPFLT